MRFRTFEYFIREAMSSLRANSMMSIASISTVALTLLILGVFLVIVLNLNYMAGTLESQVMIHVYLKDNVNTNETLEIGKKVAAVSGVTQVTFVSKDEAMERFKRRLGEQQGILTALAETNPLPNGFEVKVDKAENVRAVAQTVGQFAGVENARYGKEVVENLFAVTHIIRLVGFILMLFLIFAAVFIISNTIRITVFARRREVSIMKYVGATDWFIRWPFLIEGMVLGAGGSLIAVLLLNKTYSVLTQQVYSTLAFLPLIPKYPFMNYLCIILLILGAFIGAVGSTISLRKFLRV